MSGHDMKAVLSLLVLAILSIGLGCSAIPDEPAASSPDTSDSADTSSGDTTVPDEAADNGETHEDTDDYAWDSSSEAHILLSDGGTTADASVVDVDGDIVTISAAGSYSISGSLTDGRIIVDTEDDGAVRLILDGVDITSGASAPIFIASADKAIIVLADGSDNRLADGASYIFDDAEEEEPKATVFSKADLTIDGTGSLTVKGNFNDGISSNDGLIITSGTITVDAVDDAIRGKDYLVIHDGVITTTSSGNGLISDNENDETLGYVSIDGGDFDIASEGDAISAVTDVTISGGQFVLTSGGGSSAYYNGTVSAKGIKGSAAVVIDSGTFDIDSADDGLHSNGSLTINGGEFTISTGDDGGHADGELYVTGGRVTITESYEGLESNTGITIEGGEIHITASDDGLNVATGNDGSGVDPWGGNNPGGPGGGGWYDTSTGDYYLHITNGYVAIDAGGDGIDVAGAVQMSGGTVLVDGPTSNGDGALDHQSFMMTGGFLVATGSAGMAQAPSTSSTQRSLNITYRQAKSAGSMIHLETSGGEDLLTFAPSKTYQSCVFSSPDLQAGVTYALYQGGSSSGTEADGLYSGGTYSGGTLLGDFTASNVVTGLTAP